LEYLSNHWGRIGRSTSYESSTVLQAEQDKNVVSTVRLAISLYLVVGRVDLHRSYSAFLQQTLNNANSNRQKRLSLLVLEV